MPETSTPTFREALGFWFKLGCVSFGGPAGQIALMHRELVVERKWIGDRRFFHALNFCMLLPGPEATQLATYCGWLLHGVRGGLAAGILFLLPGALTLWGLSWFYVAYGKLSLVAGMFHGLKAAVVAIIVAALISVARRTLSSRVSWAFAIVAFWALHFWHVSFPVIVFASLGVGFLIGARWPAAFAVRGETEADRLEEAPAPAGHHPGRLLAGGLALWAAPLAIAGLVAGWDSLFVQLGWFFSKAAVVTFGGAYAVLPYVSQQAVENFHWVSTAQMVDGLGLAETTPGPLILVLQFVGFLAGWQGETGLNPLLAGTIGAAMTIWVTFVPTYLFVLLGAPFVERIRRNPGATAALAAVTAAVVGVIFNLAVWFSQHAIAPNGTLDAFALVVAVLAFVALHFFRIGILPVVVVSGALGLAWSWFGG